MKKYLSYSVGVFMLMAGVASMIQSANPNLLASADAAELSASKSSAVLAVLGIILLLLGISIIILKIINGRIKHG